MSLNMICIQRDPIFWVSMHRYHHQHVDSDKDPHSPIFGFWFSHMGWLFDNGYILEKVFCVFVFPKDKNNSLLANLIVRLIFQYQERKNVEDLRKQAFYRFIKRTYMLHLYAFAVLVYIFGGFTYLVWVVGVSTTWGYHVTFLVNSACHIWGNQAWNTGDLSKNNWQVFKKR
ncbi:putative acyl-CoA desaturase [Helianthus annuus]|nr:putative acyl-CoA desaturase [Helianthus annuus]KAJ0649710.1 putative acyl-CoA desaturase [Helianthus annuus]